MGEIIIYKQTRFISCKFDELLKSIKNYNVEIYINFSGKTFRRKNLTEYIYSKSKTNKIFILSHYSKNYRKPYFSVTFDAFNYNLSNNIKFKNRFNYLNYNYFKYKISPKINYNGCIVIFLNNSKGHYHKYLDYEKQIPNLVKNIRKHNVKNEIKIRLHPRDERDITHIIKPLKNNNVSLDRRPFEKIKQSFVIFVQNTISILEFLNLGIPLMNPKFIPYDNFNDVYLNYNNLKHMNNNINRKVLLEKYYNYIITKEEIEKYPDFVKKFFLKNLNKNKKL